MGDAFWLGTLPITNPLQRQLMRDIPVAHRGSPWVRPADEFWALHCLGSSGEGKSTLLGNLALQASERGEGVLIIDPKGDLARDVIRRSRLPADKIILCAPGRLQGRYWGLNILEYDARHPRKPRLQRLAVDNMQQMFAHLGKSDPYMTNVLRYIAAGAELAVERGGATLLDVLRILFDERYRWAVLGASQNDAAKLSLYDYEAQTEYKRNNDLGSTKSRLLTFIESPIVRLWIGTPVSTFRPLEWLSEGYLVVCDLQDMLTPTETALLGNLIVSHVITQYQLRESGLVPFDRSRRIRVIIDEFHTLATAPVAGMITNGRSYNIFPVLAHQNMSQLAGEPTIQNAVKQANTRCFFNLSSQDTRVLEQEFNRPEAEQIMALKRHEARIHHRNRDGTKRETIQSRDWLYPADEARLIAARSRQEHDRFTTPYPALPRIDWVATIVETARQRKETEALKDRRSAANLRASTLSAEAKVQAAQTSTTTNGAPHGHQTRDTSRPDQDRQNPRQTVGLPADPAGAGRAVPPGSVRGADQRAGRPRPVLPPTQPTPPPAKPRKRPESGQ